MKTLLDTGPIVAFLNRNDHYHSYVVEQMGKIAPPFYTCEAVLTESFFLMGRIPNGVQRLTELLQSEKILVDFSFWEHRSKIYQLIGKYKNIPMSLADACLVVMADEARKSSIFTLDKDFLIYRLSSGDPPGLIYPN